MRVHNVYGWALLLAALAVGGVTRLEGQRPPEERARREAAARRGWIGISFHLLGSGAGALRGAAVIADVQHGSPAERAGVEAGDTLIAWNGNADIAAALGAGGARPGETVRLRLRRGGRDREVSAVAADAPARIRVGPGGRVLIGPGGPSREIHLRLDSLRVHADSLHRKLRTMFRDSLGPRLRELERLDLPRIRMRGGVGDGMPLAVEVELGGRGVAGAEFAEINPGLAEYFGTDRGVLALRVAPRTPAAEAGLEAGDVVVSVNGEAVGGVQELRRAIGGDGAREVELEVVRRGQRRELRLRWED